MGESGGGGDDDCVRRAWRDDIFFRQPTNNKQCLLRLRPLVWQAGWWGGEGGPQNSNTKKQKTQNQGPPFFVFFPTPSPPQQPVIDVHTQLMGRIGQITFLVVRAWSTIAGATETILPVTTPARRRERVDQKHDFPYPPLFSFVCRRKLATLQQAARCSSVSSSFAYSSNADNTVFFFYACETNRSIKETLLSREGTLSLSLCYNPHHSLPLHFLPPSSWAATGPRNDPFLPSGMRINMAGSPPRAG